MDSPEAVLRQYLRSKSMRQSDQREQVLDIFMRTEEHPTIDDLYRLVRKKNPKIGLATVYRTMKLLCDADIAREVDFKNGTARFEHKYQHKHHHHMVCLECGKLIEVVSPEMEDLREMLAKKHQFTTVRHEMKIFGICRECRGGKKKKRG